MSWMRMPTRVGRARGSYVCGLEMFAEMFHPEYFSGMIPAGGAVRLSAEQLKTPT